jgi:glycine betaine/proline transport system ATP-binding protein
VFDDDGSGLRLAIDGRTKDEIQERTGAVVGLRDINIEIERGELFVVMGLSGCGKSTLVRCINRLIEPTVGQVWLNGREITTMDQEALREARRHELAMVFQHFGLMPHRNVLDNVALPLEVSGVSRSERRERAAAALDLVGLADWTDSTPAQLSGGMKQRVGLARGLAMETPVLLMDEPFSALDPVIRRDLQDELLALQESVQKTIVFITHDLNEAVRVGDRIAIMRDGEVVQVGAPNDVVLNPADVFVREFTQDVRLHGMVTAASIMDERFASIHGSTSVADLITMFDEQDLSAICCVDGEGKYLGTANAASAMRAQRSGVARIEDAPLYIGDAVWEHTVLDDLVPAGLRANHPLAVLNQDGVLIGVIPLERLARAMVSDEAAVAAVAATAEGETA